MELSRKERMNHIIESIEQMVSVYCIEGIINVEYKQLTKEAEKDFTDWQKQKFNLQFDGSEYFFVYDEFEESLLYTVNITADSYLTAAKELITLLANKF